MNAPWQESGVFYRIFMQNGRESGFPEWLSKRKNMSTTFSSISAEWDKLGWFEIEKKRLLCEKAWKEIIWPFLHDRADANKTRSIELEFLEQLGFRDKWYTSAPTMSSRMRTAMYATYELKYAPPNRSSFEKTPDKTVAQNTPTKNKKITA